jgi:hypothetical protein
MQLWLAVQNRNRLRLYVWEQEADKRDPYLHQQPEQLHNKHFTVQSAESCHPDDGDDTFLLNVSSYKSHMTSRPSRRDSSYSPPWKPQSYTLLSTQFSYTALTGSTVERTSQPALLELTLTTSRSVSSNLLYLRPNSLPAEASLANC